MKMQNKQWIAGVFAVAMMMGSVQTGRAAALKSQSNSIAVDAGREIKIAVNRGELTIEAGSESAVSFAVGFKANQDGWFARKPSEEEIKKSSVSFNSGDGVLAVFAGERLTARGTVTVPTGSALTLNVETGVLTIRPRSGRTDAYIETGIVTYDDGGSAGDSCVDAWVKIGVIEGASGKRCESPKASLRVETGTITIL
ncbi:MAG: hypothetical protein AUJ52_02185 [Elusimicrobia bacterium CG1_02_63_36]|nr:MAG: hypothetical protein AUJ52_02185 [Elusimicrobia bacterium CG1_02_63_36]PIP84151.1 MAG: hypothetical protein COR54_05720 [Elusimicrobia bacterium CG22_combo_CG10-13_8_21_14_all_63_91]PJA16427.1 MAG: hypothetical protein COX66_07475 [Elusimicrobia bacterium CG_4_10_14_0_2_um_filter_63_34]PJB25697.1 MAG: hypothetical protein CO113_07370 [Elusimicrobia bacterium CG_4_9_14_3_um_filter_62_55]